MLQTGMVKFGVGDLVTWVNDYGVKMPEKTIVGIDDCVEGKEPRYFIAPHDAPWSSIRESCLIHDADDPVLTIAYGQKIRNVTIDDEAWFLVGQSKHAFRFFDAATRHAQSLDVVA